MLRLQGLKLVFLCNHSLSFNVKIQWPTGNGWLFPELDFYFDFRRSCFVSVARKKTARGRRSCWACSTPRNTWPGSKPTLTSGPRRRRRASRSRTSTPTAASATSLVRRRVFFFFAVSRRLLRNTEFEREQTRFLFRVFKFLFRPGRRAPTRRGEAQVQGGVAGLSAAAGVDVGRRRRRSADAQRRFAVPARAAAVRVRARRRGGLPLSAHRRRRRRPATARESNKSDRDSCLVS